MPNRIIKESVCTSENIDRMSWFEECFYTRLWTACDDYGRMDARPAILKAKLFPLKDRMTLKDVESALQKLADIGCVKTYVCEGKPYLYLPAWEVHQQIRAKKSKYPAPQESDIICNQMISDDNKCPRNPIQSESNPIPPIAPPGGDVSPSRKFIKPLVEEIAEYCKSRRNGIDAQEFYDHYESNGWKVGRSSMKDWRAAVRTWERRRKEMNPSDDPFAGVVK